MAAHGDRVAHGHRRRNRSAQPAGFPTRPALIPPREPLARASGRITLS